MNVIRLIKSFFCSDIAIDLGSQNTIVYVKGEGIKINEPTLVAVRGTSIYPVQYGSEAAKLIGKSPEGIKVISPIEKGAIVDLTATEAMMEYFMAAVNQGSFLRPSPSVLVALPSSSSEVEKKAMEDAIYNAGATDVSFVKQGIAAAIGAGLDINSSSPSCVVDIGGDTTEISVLASSGIIYAKTFDVGGSDLSKSLEDFVLKKYQVKIGVENAVKLKRNIGYVIRENLDEDEKMIIQGKDVFRNRPETIEVNQLDVFEGMFEPLSKILTALDQAIEELPAETVGGLYENGIKLVGGTAQLSGLALLISEYVGLKTSVAENPTTCVIRGCGKILDEDADYFDYS